ncbi:hypothetical protein SGPA1_60153 [Streptomyces misionensis JCM 4497]
MIFTWHCLLFTQRHPRFGRRPSRPAQV